MNQGGVNFSFPPGGGGRFNAPDIKKIAKIVLTILVVIIATGFVFGCFYRVTEQQNAVVTQFGKVVRTDTAGLYFKLPYIQQVHMVDMTTHGTGIGYYVENGQNITDTSDGIMITSDFNLLDIDFYLEYKVNDPVAYLYYSEQPEEILKNIALASIRSTVVNYKVDEAMTTGKSQIQAQVKDAIAKELMEQNIGIQIVNITVQDSEPPTEEITQAFKSVETAKQGADTAKNNALQYQNQMIPQAEAEADRIVQAAEAEKTARIAEAEGQVARFEAMYEEYKKNPLITKKRMYYETIEELLPSLKVVISDGATDTMLPLESFTGDAMTMTETEGE
ncbi:MAG: FtsH protease activity modulator HflK [Lachnospiraceae bacterium]|nr:FtsH protease activity modulator HflK [Lachnospiraceae bacterium]